MRVSGRFSSTAEQFQIGESHGGEKVAHDNALPSDCHLQVPFLGLWLRLGGCAT